VTCLLDLSDKENWIWAAGLVEGEGCCTMTGRNRVVMTLVSTDRDVLQTFQSIVGGSIYGPYNDSRSDHKNRKPHWQWHSGRWEQTRHILDRLLPMLHSRRQQIMLEAVRRREEYEKTIPENRCKKLTLEQRGDIVRRASAGESKAALAREYNVSASSVTFYTRGR